MIINFWILLFLPIVSTFDKHSSSNIGCRQTCKTCWDLPRANLELLRLAKGESQVAEIQSWVAKDLLSRHSCKFFLDTSVSVITFVVANKNFNDNFHLYGCDRKVTLTTTPHLLNQTKSCRTKLIPCRTKPSSSPQSAPGRDLSDH